MEEGALASIGISSWDNGIIRVAGGGSRKAGESVGIPELAMISEHFNPLVRALEAKQTVRLRVDVAARFTDEADQPGYNTLAEIRGSSKPDEVVMIGAHGFLAQRHRCGRQRRRRGGDDGGDAHPQGHRRQARRTIRVALWSGEEQGLIGSQAYVAKHFGKFPEPTDPAQKALPASLREPTGALQKTRDYGKFRSTSTWTTARAASVASTLRKTWRPCPSSKRLAPFHDVGATTVATRNTGSTDHISFDRIGLPGFQFIQTGWTTSPTCTTATGHLGPRRAGRPEAGRRHRRLVRLQRRDARAAVPAQGGTVKGTEGLSRISLRFPVAVPTGWAIAT